MRRSLPLVLLSMLFAVSGMTPAAGADPSTAPLPIAERVLTHGPRRTRVSLFDNRVAVVSAREGDRVTVRRLTLYETEFVAILRVIEIAARERSPRRPPDRGPSTAHGEILLHLDRHGTPERIPYSPLAMPDLRTQQLLAALDDVERLVTDAPLWADEIRSWEPAMGDRVRLWDGELGTVVELLPEGFIMIQREVTSIRDAVPPGDRERLVFEIVERAAP